MRHTSERCSLFPSRWVGVSESLLAGAEARTAPLRPHHSHVVDCYHLFVFSLLIAMKRSAVRPLSVSTAESLPRVQVRDLAARLLRLYERSAVLQGLRDALSPVRSLMRQLPCSRGCRRPSHTPRDGGACGRSQGSRVLARRARVSAERARRRRGKPRHASVGDKARRHGRRRPRLDPRPRLWRELALQGGARELQHPRADLHGRKPDRARGAFGRATASPHAAQALLHQEHHAHLQVHAARPAPATYRTAFSFVGEVGVQASSGCSSASDDRHSALQMFTTRTNAYPARHRCAPAPCAPRGAGKRSWRT